MIDLFPSPDRTFEASPGMETVLENTLSVLLAQIKPGAKAFDVAYAPQAPGLADDLFFKVGTGSRCCNGLVHQSILFWLSA